MEEFLNKTIVDCTGCQASIEIMDQSPFDPDVYLYSTGCRLRVQISLYDNQYTEVEQRFTQQYPNEWSDAVSLKFFSAFEPLVNSCTCGGQFKYDAPRRCLNCSEPVPQATPGQTIWPFVEDDASTEKFDLAEDLIEKYTIEPNWIE